MKTAILAASRAKYQQIHGSQHIDPSTLKQELLNARRQKLNHKLHQARREIKSALKKSKTSETQKQIKKIKTAEKNELSKLEKELELLKHIDLDNLTEKKIKSTIQKNSALKKEELVLELLDSIEIKNAEVAEKALVSNIEARLLSHKAIIAESTSIIQTFNSTLKGDAEKIEKKRAENNEKKRKAEEKVDVKKPKIAKKSDDSSKFVESLAADDEKNDEKFQEIYEGVKKPNRVGQRQRRKQWEELYGKKANHVAAEYQKREEKRLANPEYKPKTIIKPLKSIAEPVHPSWEAKRQQQEMMSQALSGNKKSNNKIVFDD